MADSPRVAVRGLSKSFGPLTVLRDVDLEVAAGEVVCMIGPSGAGKSTLLRCVNLLETPTAGRVEIDGRDLTSPFCNVDRTRRRVGMVFQQFNLFPHLSARDNVAIALRKVARVPRAEAHRIALARLADMGVADKAAARPAQLSGGQQQRVAIARAMAMQPDVLLCDEVTSALDPELVKGILDVLTELAAGGMTMLVVTHEMGFAREVADRVVFMDGGRIVEQGPPRTLMSAPRTARLREFLDQVL